MIDQTVRSVADNAGNGRVGMARLLALGRLRRVVCSFPRSAGSVVFEERYRAGVGAILAKGKQAQVIDGREMILEYALNGACGRTRSTGPRAT